MVRGYFLCYDKGMKILWTDGSASPNPGPGGFAVLEQQGEDFAPVALGKEAQSTNIRMEGLAMIAAIKYAGSEPLEIHSDSEFWINVLTKWAPTWQARGWTKSKGEIQNLDIVKELYELYTTHDVSLIWVRGHAGTKFNELADEWANKARKGITL